MQVGPMQDTVQEDMMQVRMTGEVILVAVMVAVTGAID